MTNIPIGLVLGVQVNNNLGKYAYLAATAAGDNPSLSETYWRTICSDASNITGCKVIVSHLFTNGPNGITKGATLNKNVQAYLDFEVLGTPDAQRGMRKFFNYCGLLATVICALPESVRTVKAKQLDGMCQNYLAGQSFNPLVVSGELIVASFWNDSSLNHWWRPRACLEATTGANWAPVFTSTAANSIVKRTLIERYSSTKAKKGYYLYGDTSLSPFVAHKYGTATAPLYGPILNSVNTDILKTYGVTLEGTEGGTPLQPVEGVGIWGISPDVLSPKWNPSTPVGSVGLLVQEKTYEKSKGSYAQTFSLTGVRVLIDSGWWLMMLPKSGLGCSYRTVLWNTAGVIDSDYFHTKNEGDIILKLSVDGELPLSLKKGDKVVQGIFLPYGLTYDDDVCTKRGGGFGSTGK